MKYHILKNPRIAAFAAAMLVVASTAKAAPLPPGGSLGPPVPPVPAPVGTLLASLSAPFSSSTLIGTLFSQVYQDTLNPFGAGLLTFTYRLELSPNSPNAVSQISIGHYDSFLVDAGHFLTAGGTPPTFFGRSNEGGGSGDVLQLHFGPLAFGSDEIQPGHASDLLVIRTSASAFNQTTASVINGVAVPNIPTFTPAVPEPSTMALLGLGIGIALIGRRNHRQK